MDALIEFLGKLIVLGLRAVVASVMFAIAVMVWVGIYKSVRSALR